MDIALRLLLLQQDAGLFRAVVGAAEQSGQGNHIDVLPLLSLVCVQVGWGEGQAVEGASSLWRMDQSRSAWSRVSSSTKTLPLAWMESGTFTKQGSLRIWGVRSQQLSLRS